VERIGLQRMVERGDIGFGSNSQGTAEDLVLAEKAATLFARRF
jgi:hypothetical protein